MDFSLSSFATTLLFSSISILFLSYFISGYHIVSQKGFLFVSLIILLIVVRLFIPVEFTAIQSNIYITKFLPQIYLLLTQKRILFGNLERSIFDCFLFFSFVGSFYYVVKLIVSYMATKCRLQNYSIIDDAEINAVFQKILSEYKREAKIRIVKSDNISSPFLFGFLKPIIVLPDIHLTEEEWYFILSHEIVHYHHKDLWLRFIGEILQIIYWWNPAIFLLCRKINQFQELRTDLFVLQKLDEVQKLSYTECLLKLAKQQCISQNKWIAAFQNEGELTNRITSILCTLSDETLNNNIHKTRFTVCTYAFAILLTVFTLFFSNLVIIKPSGQLPEELTRDTFVINNQNGYLVLQEDGTYDVYVNGSYLITVTQIFDDTLKISNWKGEIIHEAKNPFHLNNLFECTF